MDILETTKLKDLTAQIEIHDYLGGGEEGSTYEAIFTSNGIPRRVAARIIKPTFMVPHPEVQVENVKDLNSPFILHPLDFGKIQYKGQEKYVQIIPLADGSLDKVYENLTTKQLVTVLLHTYWGFADAIEKGIIWGWDFSPGQILIFNKDSEDDILARLSDFGTFKQLRNARMSDIRKTLDVIISSLLTPFFNRDWRINKGTSNASEYAYGLGFLYRSEEARKNFFNQDYISTLPKDIVEIAMELGNDELPDSVYFERVKRLMNLLLIQYSITPYREVDIFASALSVVKAERKFLEE